jgi:hypothetical protein
VRCTATDEGKARQTPAASRETALTRHIALDVRVDGDAISGHAGDGTGRSRPFHGWLGLIAALDRLLANPPTDEPH